MFRKHSAPRSQRHQALAHKSAPTQPWATSPPPGEHRKKLAMEDVLAPWCILCLQFMMSSPWGGAAEGKDM